MNESWGTLVNFVLAFLSVKTLMIQGDVTLTTRNVDVIQNEAHARTSSSRVTRMNLSCHTYE